MIKKIFFTLLIVSIFSIAIASVCFAANNAMNNARSTVMSAGNTVGNAVSGAAGAVANGAKSLVNGAANVGNDAANGARDMGNDTEDTIGTTNGRLNDGDYTATRTATTNNNFLGMSDTTWTWLILGIVGLAIVGLVWYYGAQYEHRNYGND